MAHLVHTMPDMSESPSSSLTRSASSSASSVSGLSSFGRGSHYSTDPSTPGTEVGHNPNEKEFVQAVYTRFSRQFPAHLAKSRPSVTRNKSTTNTYAGDSVYSSFNPSETVTPAESEVGQGKIGIVGAEAAFNLEALLAERAPDSGKGKFNLRQSEESDIASADIHDSFVPRLGRSVYIVDDDRSDDGPRMFSQVEDRPLPTEDQDGTHFIHARDLDISDPLDIPEFTVRPKYVQATETYTPATLVLEKESLSVRFSKYMRAFIQRNYMVLSEPPLVLPTAPSDTEKLSYLINHRFSLVMVGLLAFLASSAGIWLFATASPIFYFFGVIAAFLQVYFSMFHLTGAISKNFDHVQHLEWVRDHGITPEAAPTVDIYLPCCKEPLAILENTYKYVQKLEYPEGRMKVWVLDDGGQPEVAVLASQYGFNYICRDDRGRLKKAGNLRWAFARTTGDFFVIYDADFCPRHDYLTELIPRMKADPNIAIIQTPQYFRTTDEQTWVERGAGAVQELFYRYIQVNRNKWGGAICVGSNATYRRSALVDTGGTAEVGASEDVHTGFYAVDHGWRLDYVPLNLACGICPDTPRAFFSQQVRWCQGSTSLLLNWHFWRSNLSWAQKTCYLSGMMYYSASALTIFANPLPGILLVWFKVEYVRWFNLAFALPILIYGYFVYRLWGRSKHAFCVQFIGVIQQYAYMSAIKDRILGTSFAWVPSGDNSSHKSHRYRNMRLLCIFWTFTYNALFCSGVVVQIIRGWAWYEFLPLMLLNIYLVHKALPFMCAV